MQPSAPPPSPRGVYRRLAAGGAHHQDLRFSSEHDAPAVASMRAEELAVVRSWLMVVSS